MIETIVQVDGMQCPMCESHINDVVRKNCTVKKVSSSHKKKECRILSEKPLDLLNLKKAIEETGYTVFGSQSHEYVKKGFFSKLFG